MARAHAVLGYPTMRDAAAALRAEGLTNAQVAERLGTTRASVNQALSEHRRRSGRITVTLDLSVAARERLYRAAHARNIQPATLATHIVTTACTDDMINAILDDGIFTP